jgi:GrpB-like predicted nucleotidyltransferase (UPF0157 family)
MKLKKRVEVVEYDPNWPLIFKDLYAVLNQNVGELVLAIEHVGSTSVPGLAAKPIIDLDIIVADRAALQLVIEKLAALGYTHQGDLGIKDREAFRRADTHTPDDKSGRVWPVHHLYVCVAGSESLRNHLAFRDFLRAHPEKMQQYAVLKKQLAVDYEYDMDSYIAGKTAFVMAIVGEAQSTD